MGYKVNDVVNTGGFPFYLIEGLKREFKIDYFVETGTAGGLSIKEASKLFKYCWTIELIEGRAEIDHSLGNVRWLTGHSVDVLLPILNDFISEKNAMQVAGEDSRYHYVVFFLDAHYSDPTPNTSIYKECYLLEELELISPYQDSAIIVIDDARLFYGPPPAPNNPLDWPSIAQIFDLLNRKYPYNTNTIRDDYIISFPSRLNEPMDEEWRNRYTTRYPSHEDSIRQQTKNVYKEFINYLR